MRRFIAGIAVVLMVVLWNVPAAASDYTGSAIEPGNKGHWLSTPQGKVTAFGAAAFYGDMSSAKLNRPIVGMASTASGKGYWLVAADGGIFSFGDAAFYGSTGSLTLNQPIVGMAGTTSSKGYWLVAADGGIFAFGDAQFFGSTGGITLNKPIVGMSATSDGGGYWLTASDGGIFAFGSAQFFGSTGGINLNKPVVAMSSTPTGKGYWLAASDGGIFAFGDARFLGSNTGKQAPTLAIVPDTKGGYTIVTASGETERLEAPVTSDEPAPTTTAAPTTTPTTAPPSSTTTTTTTVVPVPTGTTTSTTATPTTTTTTTAVPPTTTTTAAPTTTTSVTTTTAVPTTTTTTRPPTTTTTTRPSTDVSGPWTQIFYDDFNTNVSEGGFLSTYGNKWSAYPTSYRDTSKKGQYNPGIISVNNGIMNMRMHTENGVPQVAAPMPLINGYGVDKNQLYGRYEARFRADPVAKYKTAWLLWPKSGVWPRDGEIDFPEGNLDGTIGAFMHRQDGTSGGDQDAFKTNARHPDWHTAVIEWMPGRINFILDGTTIGSSTSRIPNTPMRWVLQSETSLSKTVYPDPAAVANVQVDYVKVWKYTP